MRKVIVTAALTGGLHTKAKNPNLPEQPDEIARQAMECFEAGAAIVHLHARDKQGLPTADGSTYEEIHRMIRKKCNVILQDTSGGAPHLTPEDKLRGLLKAKPEMASLNMGTMVRTKVEGKFKNSVFKNTSDDIETLAKALLDAGIKPEMEVFSHAMFVDVDNLIKKGLVKKPYYINLVLGMGYQGCEDAKSKNLISMISFLPEGSVFNVCAIGKAELDMTTLSILLGGNCRVGMEDNIYYKKGVLVKSNAQLVSRSVRIIRELNMEVATPDEAREMLAL